MVTHDLRMTHFAGKMFQMKDSKVSQIIEDRAEIDALVDMAD